MRRIITALLCAFALMAGSSAASVPASAASPAVSMWGASETPTNPNYRDTRDIVLGQQFKATKSGLITGVRFYKGTANTGTHVGALYRDGKKIAQITFPTETASGWQEASFPQPVRPIVGATYTVAYTAPDAFNRDAGYFANGRTVSSPDGSLTTTGAGLYAYSSDMTEPTTSNGLNTNYWVDVAFTADSPAAPPVAALECPSNGAGGALTDRFNQSHTDAAGSTSQYHIWASGIDQSKPVGIVVQLHGDGAGEFPRYADTNGKLGRMAAVAKGKNMILVSVKTPDRTLGTTWWQKPGITVPYLNSVLDREVFGKYNIEKDRVWFAGYSGGAEVLSLYSLKTAFPNICGGGAIMAGGGTAISSSYAGQASDETRSDFRMHFYTGQNDTAANAGDGFCGYCAAQRSATYWEGKGFNVTRNFPAGVNHYQLNEPAELERVLNLYVPAP